ncbi:MAG: PAS domain S-box protein [Candidatus Eisenbacteria bacterium]|uniref:histidine kinase n=1 Tax=Eiseniibacteriota bacterium TaxID=2212470 RepID=A0A933SEH2_UNCEI|nr:PAS domain S-box protein [Candidatus Eisenbacteria bacterium]
MSRSRLLEVGRWVSFGVLLLAAVVLRERPSQVFDEAIIWLPSGVAIAGVYLLGARAAWVVAGVTILQRLLLQYEWGQAWPGAAGSTCEALLGAYLLRRLRFDTDCARLRDVGALLATAAIAPFGSLFFSYIARMYVWPNPAVPFYSDWDAWWRMNALGVLAIVPVALTWLRLPRREWTAGLAGRLLVSSAGIVALILATLDNVPPGTIGILWLHLLMLPLVMYAAARFGVRATAFASALAALVVSLATSAGHGPFLDVVKSQRHTAVQLFELSFLAVPLAFGALISERREAESREMRSDALRRSMQSALPDLTYRLRRDGVFLDVSIPPGMRTPAPRDELIGRSLDDFVSPEHARLFREAIERTLTERGPVTVEYEIPVGGMRLAREARCVPHGDDEVLAVVRDISSRKWAERTIAFEAAVLEWVAEGRPPGEVYAAIVAGLEHLLPGAMCSIIELDGTRLHVATAPSLPAAYNAAVEGVEIGPEVGSCGTAAYHGKTVVVREIATSPLWAPWKDLAHGFGLAACWSVPIRGAAGTVLGTCAVYHSEPREPEPQELALAERAGALAGIALERASRIEALRRSQDLLEAVNRNVKEGLFRTDPEGVLVYANLGLARLFGFESPEQMLGFRLGTTVVDPERRVQLRRLAREQGQWLNEEVECRRQDGTTFWGLISGTTVRDEAGEIRSFDGAVADITARKELELQLRQSQKMEAVGKLAGGVAHDFNNLLTVIYGAADAIRAEVPTGGVVHSHAEQVLDAASRASRLTRQLLAYSRQQVLSPRVLDLTLVVDQMGGMLRRLIGEDYRLVIEHASGPLWVRVDPSQIEQVLLNLLVNARDAMPDGGAITIRTERARFLDANVTGDADLGAGPRAILSVRDDGEGMSEEVKARAFDPFFTTKPLGQGTGLGLSTVYGIVKQSGGAVWLDSTPGRGTTARIALPISAEPIAEPDAPAPAASTGQSGTLLVVEDEPGVRALVCMTLRRAGYDVLEAADGEWGVSAAAQHAGPIDLVVTDVVMPRLNGPAMAARLLAARPGLRFLFMSGYPDDARAPQEFIGSAGAFLAKPFTPSQLLHAARAAITSPPVSAGRS